VLAAIVAIARLSEKFMRYMLLTLVSLVATNWVVPASDAGAADRNGASSQFIEVSNCGKLRCLKLNGNGPWRPKGLIIVGLAAARSSWPMLTGKFREITEGYSPQVLRAARNFGADSIRFNVAQVNLDSQSQYYDAGYAPAIEAAVSQARALGMTVLLQINDEQPPNTGRAGHPTDATSRAWQQLAGRFNSDRGVMYGLYNEPTMSGTSPTDLAEWQSGYNGVMATVRASGSKNVVVVDCPHFADDCEVEALSYLITDPANNTVYGVHPFPRGPNAHNTPRGWGQHFRDFCSSGQVLCQITAWNIYYVSPKVESCPHGSLEAYQRTMPDVMRELFDTAKSLNSGVYGWAFDYPDVIMDSRAPLTKPVGFGNFLGCEKTQAPWGGGELLKEKFNSRDW
jgi:endoglucanase